MDYYEAKHSQVLDTVKSRGAPIVFTLVTGGEYDPETDTSLPPQRSQVNGYAVELPQDPEEYRNMELVLQEDVILMFVPNVFGQRPAVGGVTDWAGRRRVVTKVLPYRPAEVVLAAKVVVR
jgi:hypothetical protein